MQDSVSQNAQSFLVLYSYWQSYNHDHAYDNESIS